LKTSHFFKRPENNAFCVKILVKSNKCIESALSQCVIRVSFW